MMAHNTEDLFPQLDFPQIYTRTPDIFSVDTFRTIVQYCSMKHINDIDVISSFNISKYHDAFKKFSDVLISTPILPTSNVNTEDVIEYGIWLMKSGKVVDITSLEIIKSIHNILLHREDEPITGHKVLVSYLLYQAHIHATKKFEGLLACSSYSFFTHCVGVKVSEERELLFTTQFDHVRTVLELFCNMVNECQLNSFESSNFMRIKMLLDKFIVQGHNIGVMIEFLLPFILKKLEFLMRNSKLEPLRYQQLFQKILLEFIFPIEEKHTRFYEFVFNNCEEDFIISWDSKMIEKFKGTSDLQIYRTFLESYSIDSKIADNTYLAFLRNHLEFFLGQATPLLFLSKFCSNVQLETIKTFLQVNDYNRVVVGEIVLKYLLHTRNLKVSDIIINFKQEFSVSYFAEILFKEFCKKFDDGLFKPELLSFFTEWINKDQRRYWKTLFKLIRKNRINIFTLDYIAKNIPSARITDVKQLETYFKIKVQGLNYEISYLGVQTSDCFFKETKEEFICPPCGMNILDVPDFTEFYVSDEDYKTLICGTCIEVLDKSNFSLVQCAVCYQTCLEAVMALTNCGHIICKTCGERLRANLDFLCPLCRGFVNHSPEGNRLIKTTSEEVIEDILKTST